jgi:hypothetical protein
MNPDNSRPIGNTPITDAAAATAPDESGNYASNADIRVNDEHLHDAEIGENDRGGARQPGVENAPANDMTDNDPSRAGEVPEGNGLGGTDYPENSTDAGVADDEEENEAKAVEYGAGTAEEDDDEYEEEDEEDGQYLPTE